MEDYALIFWTHLCKSALTRITLLNSEELLCPAQHETLRNRSNEDNGTKREEEEEEEIASWEKLIPVALIVAKVLSSSSAPDVTAAVSEQRR